MGSRQIKCENCDQYYSSSRSKCPHCGAKRSVSSKRSGSVFSGNRSIIIGVVVLLVIIILVIVVVYRSMNNSGTDNPNAGASSSIPPSSGLTEVTNTPDPSMAPLVPVDDIPAESVYIDVAPEFFMTTGTYVDLAAILTPLDATSTVIWQTSDGAIASVDPTTGKLTGVGAGDVTITVYAGSASATCLVHIFAQGSLPSGGGTTTVPGQNPGITLPGSVTTHKLSRDDIMLSKSNKKAYGNKYQLKLDSGNIPASDCKFVSNDTKVATVSDSGVITAVGKGHAVITVTYDGETYKCQVYVID